MRTERKAQLSRGLAESLAEFIAGLRNWATKHQKLVGIFGGGMVLGLLVWGGLSAFWNYQRASGLTALDEGLQEVSNSAPEKAIGHLQAAADRLSGQARQLALIQLGFAYEKQDETDKAAEVYEQAFSGETAPNYLSQIAMLRLAKVAEQSGDEEAAKAHYTKAADLDGPGKEEALLGAAQVLEQVNDTEKAQQYYQQFLDTAVNSPLREVVEGKVD